MRYGDSVQIPATHLPSFKSSIAMGLGVEKNLLIKTWGGLGDEICAEPTLRYLSRFRGRDGLRLFLAAERPELFAHLKFDKVIDLRKETFNHEAALVLETITPPNDTNLVWQFMSHAITNCVDFPSLCAIRMQLPVDVKDIRLFPQIEEPLSTELTDHGQRSVIIHAGKHWQSKTFPASFWNAVLREIRSEGVTPVLIGADTCDNRSTVNVDTAGCLDFRNKLSIMESIYLLKNAKVLLTNDSSPLHMAACGHAWVGYIATCKHPDYITHWRNGQWQWREVNFSRGGVWDLISIIPNNRDEVSVEHVPQNILESWLPDPVEYASWAVRKLRE